VNLETSNITLYQGWKSVVEK